MSIIYFPDADIFDQEVEAIVNPVNCVGVMGHGLAAAFRERYPSNLRAYHNACLIHVVRLGGVLFHDLQSGDGLPKYIINFPTKQHWRDDSQIRDIRSGMVALCDMINDKGIKSIAIPQLGCGLGKLNWDDVKPLIVEACEDHLHSSVEVRVLG